MGSSPFPAKPRDGVSSLDHVIVYFVGLKVGNSEARPTSSLSLLTPKHILLVSDSQLAHTEDMRRKLGTTTLENHHSKFICHLGGANVQVVRAVKVS
jgi:hypothetical protein